MPTFAAELADLREAAVGEATEVRALELGRLDAMLEGLWSRVREGSPPAVSAAVRVSERRSRLLGLDAPIATRSELTGSLGVYAERLATERELFATLDVTQLERLAAASQALVDRALMMAKANARALTAGGSIAGSTSTDGDPAVRAGRGSRIARSEGPLWRAGAPRVRSSDRSSRSSASSASTSRTASSTDS